MKNNSLISLADFLLKDSTIDTSLAKAIISVAKSCRDISAMLSRGAIDNFLGTHNADKASINVQGEEQKKLDVLSNDAFINTNQSTGLFAGLASEEMEEPYQIPDDYDRGEYLLVFDPLDGSSNIDVNVSVGSIFSILKSSSKNTAVSSDCFLQAGNKQLAAGYALYGPNTVFVITTGSGVYGFTLDNNSDEYYLMHSNITISHDTKEYAINSSNARFWTAPIKRYIDECVAGKSGARDVDFNMRWVGSLVAEAHRILTRGGVFLYPQDNKNPGVHGRLRLLYEANPIGWIIEQAGGKSSTGKSAILNEQPSSLHQRIGFVFGSKNEVERIEKYHL